MRLTEGETITIGAHDWRVVMGNGHSPEHACLYCPELNLLISGDQVLPRISTNVSVYAENPESNPLLEWLASIEKLKRCVPRDVLVLPSHNEPFVGLHARLTEMTESRHESLGRLSACLDQPKRAVDVFSALFKRPAPDSAHFLWLATGESLAYLNYLRALGRVVRHVDTKDDVHRYVALA